MVLCFSTLVVENVWTSCLNSSPYRLLNRSKPICVSGPGSETSRQPRKVVRRVSGVRFSWSWNPCDLHVCICAFARSVRFDHVCHFSAVANFWCHAFEKRTKIWVALSGLVKMSIETKEPIQSENLEFTPPEYDSVPDGLGTSQPTDASRPKRRRKLSSRVNVWIRRIHLYSGFFMLPWVLLYGFTALLFNHPTYLTDSKTEIEIFALADQALLLLPNAEELARQVVEDANAKLVDEESGQVVQLADAPNAVFTRQVSGSTENDTQSVSVVLDLNSGEGYLRKRSREPDAGKSDEKKSEEKKSPSLEEGLRLNVASDPVAAFKTSVDDLLRPMDLDSEELQLRSMPNLEFDAIIDGEKMRLRLAQEGGRRRGRRPVEADDADSEPASPFTRAGCRSLDNSRVR